MPAIAAPPAPGELESTLVSNWPAPAGIELPTWALIWFARSWPPTVVAMTSDNSNRGISETNA
jgi:hypothetical protein